jgi:hypothetical protein
VLERASLVVGHVLSVFLAGPGLLLCSAAAMNAMN